MSRPRIVTTPAAEHAVYEGWKEICAALGVSFKAAYAASRRAVDPLRVNYDGFDRPWIYRAWLAMWVKHNNRSAQAYDNEKQLREAPTQNRRST